MSEEFSQVHVSKMLDLSSGKATLRRSDRVNSKRLLTAHYSQFSCSLSRNLRDRHYYFACYENCSLPSNISSPLSPCNRTLISLAAAMQPAKTTSPKLPCSLVSWLRQSHGHIKLQGRVVWNFQEGYLKGADPQLGHMSFCFHASPFSSKMTVGALAITSWPTGRELHAGQSTNQPCITYLKTFYMRE